MATLQINEFTDVGNGNGGTIPVYAGTQTDQPRITTSSSSQQSSVFAASTKIVRVTAAGGAVCVAFGPNPTATTASGYLADGQSFDYFTGGLPHKVAVINYA